MTNYLGDSEWWGLTDHLRVRHHDTAGALAQHDKPIVVQESLKASQNMVCSTAQLEPAKLTFVTDLEDCHHALDVSASDEARRNSLRSYQSPVKASMLPEVDFSAFYEMSQMNVQQPPYFDAAGNVLIPSRQHSSASQALDKCHNERFLTVFRCREHGCDGRTFSSVENYKRHIREKRRDRRYTCEYCYLSFTRQSNLNQHHSLLRCKFLQCLEAFDRTA